MDLRRSEIIDRLIRGLANSSTTQNSLNKYTHHIPVILRISFFLPQTVLNTVFCLYNAHSHIAYVFLGDIFIWYSKEGRKRLFLISFYNAIPPPL